LPWPLHAELDDGFIALPREYDVALAVATPLVSPGSFPISCICARTTTSSSDAKVRAPFDAMKLQEKLGLR
jgi:hypothetical protein